MFQTSYLKAMGLAGGMVWALDLDDFRNNCGCERYPLLSAAARELGLISTPQPQCSLESSSPGKNYRKWSKIITTIVNYKDKNYCLCEIC